LPEYVICK